MRRKIYLFLLLVGLFSSMNAQDYRFSGSSISNQTKVRNMVYTIFASRYLLNEYIPYDVPLYYYRNNRCLVNCKTYKKVESFGEIAKGDMTGEFELTYENGLLKTMRVIQYGIVYRFIFNEQKYLTDVYKYNSSGNELYHVNYNSLREQFNFRFYYKQVAYSNSKCDYYVPNSNDESTYLFEYQTDIDGKYGEYRWGVLYHVYQNQISCIRLQRWTKLNAKGRFNDNVHSKWQRGYWEQDGRIVDTYQFIRDGFYIQSSKSIYDYEEQIF